jgi:hypothetical protein
MLLSAVEIDTLACIERRTTVLKQQITGRLVHSTVAIGHDSIDPVYTTGSMNRVIDSIGSIESISIDSWIPTKDGR